MADNDDERSSGIESESEQISDNDGSEVDGVPLVDVMQTFFTNENGENVADILMNVGTKIERQLIAQNKILVKLYGCLNQK